MRKTHALFLLPFFILCACPQQPESWDEPAQINHLGGADGSEAPPPRQVLPAREDRDEQPSATKADAGTNQKSYHVTKGLPRLKNGLGILARDGRLYVTDGQNKASLPICGGVVSVTAVAHNRSSGKVRITTENGCCLPEPLIFSVNVLRSRLRNVAGLKAHHEKSYDRAARAFGEAAALDPTFDKAATNLACAHVLGNNAPKALAALEPRLAQRPAQSYLYMLADPELQPLLSTERVKRLHAPQKGTARVGFDDLLVKSLFVAHSPHHRLLASLTVHHSWGADSWQTRLLVFDSQGQEVARFQLVDWADTNEMGRIRPARRRSVQRRLSMANRLFRDLGFHVPADLEASVFVPAKTVGARRARFAQSKVSLVTKAPDARVVKGNIVLGERRDIVSFDTVGRPVLVPSASVALFHYSLDEPEGCDTGSDITGVAVVPFASP